MPGPLTEATWLVEAYVEATTNHIATEMHHLNLRQTVAPLSSLTSIDIRVPKHCPIVEGPTVCPVSRPGRPYLFSQAGSHNSRVLEAAREEERFFDTPSQTTPTKHDYIDSVYASAKLLGNRGEYK